MIATPIRRGTKFGLQACLRFSCFVNMVVSQGFVRLSNRFPTPHSAQTHSFPFYRPCESHLPETGTAFRELSTWALPGYNEDTEVRPRSSSAR